MRFLNKIIFIHSAQIQYAEINLDGNVHFIGTQGVGKSTLLRAILYFYNADSVNLGIPREKKSYVDYYFPFANSYIVYEVVRDEGKFCVLSYKSHNRVCFRFFDGPYRQEYFVDAQGDVSDQWERIAQRLDAQKVAYVRRKIENYTEYRDILYGNHEGKQGEFKRYALMESKEYANIPKTIQNVFLNSKMEADFIKQTIILSLENDVRIELGAYAHHLKDFELHLADIRRFNEPRTLAQGENISKMYHRIQNLEREKRGFAQGLGQAWAHAQAQEMPLKEDFAAKELEREKLEARRNRLEDEYRRSVAKVQEGIAVLNNKLREARELSKKYEAMDMPQLLQRLSRKSSLDSDLQRLQAEKNRLLKQQQALTESYESRLRQILNEQQGYENALSKEKLSLDQALLQVREHNGKRTEGLVEELRKHHKDEVQHAREVQRQRIQERSDCNQQRLSLKAKNFLESEIFAEREHARTLAASATKTQAELAEAARERERVESQHRLAEEALQRSFEDSQATLQGQLRDLSAQAATIDGYLAAQENALYGWLSREVPGWQGNIGKVIDQERLLFHAGLSPERLQADAGLYGIAIDLSQLDQNVKTLAQYEQESAALKKSVLSCNEQLLRLQEGHVLKREAQQKKVNASLKEINANSNALAYELEKIARLQDESLLREAQFKRDAIRLKEEAIALADENLRLADKAESEAKEQLDQLEQEMDKKVRGLLRERDKLIESENAKTQALKAEIDSKIKAQATRFDALKKALEVEQKHELAAKGVDVGRLQQLELEIYEIVQELDFIDRNREIVAIYRQHKIDLLDCTDEFRIQKQGLESQLAQARERHDRLMEKLGVEWKALQAEIQDLGQRIDEIRADRDAMELFAATELYESIAQLIQEPDGEQQALLPVRILIDKLKDIHYDQLRQQTDALSKAVVDFVGKFSLHNLFQFKTQVGDLSACMEFAAMLTDFIGERKIERFEKEVNERFALIISTIGREVTTMMAEAGKIQAVVRRINEDFASKNFVGAIKRIELRVEDSKNEIVLLLMRIKQFNDENALQLGAANLFSTDGQEKKNKDAVDLLKQFLKHTAAQGADRGRVTLADSFDLKFRIEENTNDTGWVEKLSNVGSEGTDVLVKAMLNIMLLNVFKEGASRRFKDFKLHCMMDEIGKLHPTNVRGILNFGNQRNILLINSSPIENDALAFKYIYKLNKDANSTTRVSRIITQEIPQ